MKLNNTPVRTSRNFGINNIEVDVDVNDKFFDSIEEFNNYSAEVSSSKNEILELEDIDESVNLAYGVGIENKKFNKRFLINVNSKTDSDIKLFFDFDGKNANLTENIDITANEGTKATIYILYKSNKTVKAFHNGVLKVNASKDAKINIVLINMLNNKSNNFYSIDNTLQDNANVKYTIVDFGGKNSITNLYSNLIGESANNSINTIYIGKNDEVLDLNYIGELRGKKSNIDIEVQGALKDKAKKHFKGTIDFKKGCKKATGNENENCMLMSDKATSLAMPMLLCSEEDVEGNHSTSSGKADDKELFYIMTRGFSQNDALKLLVRARFNKILETIKDKGIKEYILKEIDLAL